MITLIWRCSQWRWQDFDLRGPNEHYIEDCSSHPWNESTLSQAKILILPLENKNNNPNKVNEIKGFQEEDDPKTETKNSGGGDSDGNSDSDSGIAAKPTEEPKSTKRKKMKSKAEASANRVRESELQLKKSIWAKRDVVEEEEIVLKSNDNKAKLADKLMRLKIKYENLAKRCKNGKDPVFSKLHDKKSYELSKEILGKWANDFRVDMDSEGLNLFDNKFGSGMVYFNGIEEMILKKSMEVLKGEQRAVMERKLMKLKVVELELYL
ncbi:hypothetical protein CCACVL1_21474 [Corchorus capsularis]|uniref:Glabrous enhancer-binding protein-like DBD domain-containing protein n=1 Tax=Corchorus capsularis TaxID=210143 RepID=A0A1R3H5J1_COCAP|nr:hypothetical protein CCACVL1_21474 [Corchorus capsularis]